MLGTVERDGYMRRQQSMSILVPACIPWAFLFVLLVSVGLCEAQDIGQAKARFLEGIELVEQEKYQEALAAFEDSYRIYPKASVLFNIGMCQKALFKWNEAISTFEKYLNSTDERNPERRLDAEKAIEEMMVLVGTVPTPQTQLTQEEAGSAVLRKTGWGLFGAGAAVAVGGMVTGIMALSINKDLESDCNTAGCPPDSHDELDKRDNLATASTVLIVSGSALVITGAVLLIVDHLKQKKKASAVVVTPIVTPQFAGASVSWRF
jgi:hypothetical protein